MVCLLTVFVLPATAQETIKIAGKIVDEQTRAPIPFVHIYTGSLESGTVADEKGFFLASVTATDTLIFSCVGYHLFKLDVRSLKKEMSTDIVISMAPKVYLLNDLNVNAYPSLEEFKREVVDLNIEPETTSFSINVPTGYLRSSPFRATDKGEPGVRITGPASLLYNAFSREGKQNRRLRTYHRQQENHDEIKRKYNLEMVKNITQLNEGQAKRFMEWCTFDDDYILQCSEYELAVAVLKCLDEFHKADTLR